MSQRDSRSTARSIPAILLGGSTNALSVARSLGATGVAVDVFDMGRADDFPARHSRSVRRHFAVRADQSLVDQWRKLLAEECEPSVILPCCDDGLELVARHRGELASLGHRPIEANDELLLDLLDKARTYELARRLGVPCPSATTLSSRSDLDAAHDFPLPAAVKPVNAHVFAHRFARSPKGLVVRDFEQLVEVSGPAIDEGVPMLLTEIIEGSDDCCSYYTYIDSEGTPLTHFTKQKLRQYPVGFGLGTYHVTKWDPEVAELGLRFFVGAGLRGLGNIEFKRDARDGVLKLIESNPRFTQANELVRKSGIDFARLAYARLVDQPLPPIDRFTDDIALWFPLDDVRAFREYRSRGELSTADWVRSLRRRQVCAQFAWSDPKPSFEHALMRARRFAARRSSSL